MANDVAVTGLGVICGLGSSIAAFCKELRNGATTIRPDENARSALGYWAPLPAMDFRRSVGELPTTPACRDRLLRVGLQASAAVQSTLLAACQAWIQADSRAPSERIGVIIAGSNLNNHEVVGQQALRLNGRKARPSYAAQYYDSYYAGLLSEVLEIRGEGYSAGGASASGGVALTLARRALCSGDLDAVLVVGPPTMLSEVEIDAFISIGALRQTHARPYQPFQALGGGFLYGQSAAALMLENAGHVRQKSVLARLRAASLHQAPTRSTNPSVEAEVACMRAALAQAALDRAQIDVVNAHATGTLDGDVAEAEAIAQVFGAGQGTPVVTATKALTAHSLCSAGIVEAVASVIQLVDGFVHANPFLSEPLDRRLSFAGTVAQERPLSTVLSNSFGFGGINTSQIFSRDGEVTRR